MISLVTQHGLHQAIGIPHALTGITSIIRVDSLDRILLGIGKVYQHILRQIVHHISYVTGRHDQVDILWQFVIENGRLLRSSTHVIATKAVATFKAA